MPGSRIESFRIVESEPEASLHPRAIWEHWKKNVIWDPRTYYAVLEFSAVLIIILSVASYQSENQYDLGKVIFAIIILCVIPVLHWFSNYRRSSNALTKSRTHIFVLIFLAVLLLFGQIFSTVDTKLRRCSRYGCSAPSPVDTLNGLMWLTIITSTIAAYVVYAGTRNRQKDALLAELPSPVDVPGDADERALWTGTADVADGIQDDSLEPEGQLRL